MTTRLSYRGWSGSLRGRVGRWIPLARTSLLLVFRRRVFWLFLALGLLNFFFHFAAIYLLASLEAGIVQTGHRLPFWVRGMVFTGSGDSYRDFITMQSVVVLMMLAFAGSILVGNDFRHRSVAFYLAKPITKLEYLVGKLAAVSGLVALVTLVPALLLFVEYGLFTESWSYFAESGRLLAAIVGYGLVVSLVPSLLLLASAAVLQRTVLIAVAWGGIFVFLPLVSQILSRLTIERGGAGWRWKLLDLWWVLDKVSDLFFGIETGGGRKWAAALSVVLFCASVSLVVFSRRLKAVEVF